MSASAPGDQPARGRTSAHQARRHRSSQRRGVRAEPCATRAGESTSGPPTRSSRSVRRTLPARPRARAGPAAGRAGRRCGQRAARGASAADREGDPRELVQPEGRQDQEQRPHAVALGEIQRRCERAEHAPRGYPPRGRTAPPFRRGGARARPRPRASARREPEAQREIEVLGEVESSSCTRPTEHDVAIEQRADRDQRVRLDHAASLGVLERRVEVAQRRSARGSGSRRRRSGRAWARRRHAARLRETRVGPRLERRAELRQRARLEHRVVVDRQHPAVARRAHPRVARRTRAAVRRAPITRRLELRADEGPRCRPARRRRRLHLVGPSAAPRAGSRRGKPPR